MIIIQLNYECGACILRQVKEVIDLSTEDDNLRFELMQDSIRHMARYFNANSQPNRLATQLNQYIKQKTKCEDAYFKHKQLSNKIALSLISKAHDIIKTDDSLENYVKIAIVGNILDFGAYGIGTDFESLMNENLHKNLAINDIDKLESALKYHNDLLYLADNAGEIVFDTLLIEKIREYDVNVTVAVKSSPIVNDACTKEALDAGLDKLAKIVTLGCDSGGIVEDMFSDEFRKIFDKSNFIIAKGLANYEGLTEMDLKNKDVFSLLCSKCRPISKNLSVDINSVVLKKI